MLYTTTYVNVENDYRREQLRRSFRPVLGRRAAKALGRTRTDRPDTDLAS